MNVSSSCVYSSFLSVAVEGARLQSVVQLEGGPGQKKRKLEEQWPGGVREFIQTEEEDNLFYSLVY